MKNQTLGNSAGGLQIEGTMIGSFHKNGGVTQQAKINDYQKKAAARRLVFATRLLARGIL